MRTRVKICGITRPEDAHAAVSAGADAIGLVFYAPSPRAVTPSQARQIVDVLPPFVTVVGLFVDATKEFVEQTLSDVCLDLLQFHGNESASECARYKKPFLKAIRVRQDTNLLQCCLDFRDAQALLFDAYSDAAVGGTGQTFDWSLIPQRLPKPIILAGGLSAENVTSAIKQVRPYAVD
ncbi:MAG TPA: phosphoribosylanthranilate isomerase, partial [Rugosibacter sp.]|nr:phosphoribosylanthranilate isomerase [Rugosibacter sp.]